MSKRNRRTARKSRSRKVVKQGIVADSAIFQSQRDDWATPPLLFEELRREFVFTLDPCCNRATAKAARFCALDRGDNGLAASWERSRVFCNPPYGRAIRSWMLKAAREAVEQHATVVCLVPARTDTQWWHQTVKLYASEVRFLKGRLRFYLHGEPGGPAPFPTAVVVFRPGGRPAGEPLIVSDQRVPRRWEDLRRHSLAKLPGW